MFNCFQRLTNFFKSQDGADEASKARTGRVRAMIDPGNMTMGIRRRRPCLLSWDRAPRYRTCGVVTAAGGTTPREDDDTDGRLYSPGGGPHSDIPPHTVSPHIAHIPLPRVGALRCASSHCSPKWPSAVRGRKALVDVAGAVFGVSP